MYANKFSYAPTVGIDSQQVQVESIVLIRLVHPPDSATICCYQIACVSEMERSRPSGRCVYQVLHVLAADLIGRLQIHLTSEKASGGGVDTVESRELAALQAELASRTQVHTGTHGYTQARAHRFVKLGRYQK